MSGNRLIIKTTYTLRNLIKEENITHKHYHPHTHVQWHTPQNVRMNFELCCLNNSTSTDSHNHIPKITRQWNLFLNTRHMPQSHHHSKRVNGKAIKLQTNISHMHTIKPGWTPHSIKRNGFLWLSQHLALSNTDSDQNINVTLNALASPKK